MIIKGNALIQEIERLTGNLIDIQQRVCPAVIKFVHMQALITELLCTIYTSDDFKEIRKTIKDLDHKIYRYFTLFLSVVEQHYKEGLTVQQYADMLGVSVRSLGNYVKECTTNCTPQQIITNRIIIETKRLLLTTNKSWKEIASIVNIDASNLTKLFKKTTGITPLKFKEQGYR